MKIGLLILSTSNGRKWLNPKETYFYNITLKSFLLTEGQNKAHLFTFYVGLDKNDSILDTAEFRSEVSRLVALFSQIEVKYFYMDGIAKGHLTMMWNRLFEKALADDCDYFFQCGDDIAFQTNGWVNDCIAKLQMNNNLGLTGPVNNNPRILTQSFVSRRHQTLFGYYFPPEIINWFCDDWINEVYRGLNAYFPLLQHSCVNIGGKPRYTINNDDLLLLNYQGSINGMRKKCTEIVKKDLIRAKANINC